MIEVEKKVILQSKVRRNFSRSVIVNVLYNLWRLSDNKFWLYQMDTISKLYNCQVRWKWKTSNGVVEKNWPGVSVKVKKWRHYWPNYNRLDRLWLFTVTWNKVFFSLLNSLYKVLGWETGVSKRLVVGIIARPNLEFFFYNRQEHERMFL